jgi:2-C-methyl-D-erythritol 2,4-cyclodiphosphate synthase
MYFGIGYDIHKLVKGRKLILCGVEIDYSRGLLGHSDADVTLHAVMDALLGAAGLNDIGHYFPDTNSKYKNISSLLLLKKTTDVLFKKKFKINNIDIMIVVQKPKISPFIPKMKKNISQVLKISPKHISIKATTNEGVGFIGKGQAIAAFATAALS